jgi:hypothetical protein
MLINHKSPYLKILSSSSYCYQHGQEVQHRARQHTSAYVSIRQHSSAYRYQYGQEEQDRARRGQGHLFQHTSAYVSIRQHTSGYVQEEKDRARHGQQHFNCSFLNVDR